MPWINATFASKQTDQLLENINVNTVVQKCILDKTRQDHTVSSHMQSIVFFFQTKLKWTTCSAATWLWVFVCVRVKKTRSDLWFLTWAHSPSRYHVTISFNDSICFVQFVCVCSANSFPFFYRSHFIVTATINTYTVFLSFGC